MGFLTMMGLFFFGFYQNGVRLKKITNLGKSCLIGTTSYAEVVPIRHDFCHVILKLCQFGTTSVLSYWSRANLARLLPRHNFLILFLILLFIYWVVNYVMLKINFFSSLRVQSLLLKLFILQIHNNNSLFIFQIQSNNQVIVLHYRQTWSIHDYPIFRSLKLTLLENYVSN